MKLWNRQSISGRLTRVNLLVSGIALLLAYVSFLAYDLYISRQSLISSLGTEAAIVSANSVTALVFDDQQAAETTLSALRGSPHVLSAVIVGEDGTVFAQYFRDRLAQPVVGPALDQVNARAIGREDEKHPCSGAGSCWHNPGNGLSSRRNNGCDPPAARVGLISACIPLLCFAQVVLATATIRHMVTEPH
jgi:hypothetical protein